MTEQQQPATAEIVAPESEIVDPTIEQAGGADTPETVAETDEEKNAREIKERQDRSEKRARGVQKRLDELTADKYAERSAREAAERRLAQYELERHQQRQPAQQPDQDGPKREQFDDYERFIEALAEWRAMRAFESRMAEAQRQSAQAQQQRAAEQQATELQRGLKDKQDAFAKDVPDYFDVVNNDDIEIPPAAAIAIIKHKESARLMYEIGKNPALAESLQGMDPAEQLIAVGEIAASLKRSPQVSKAPTPGKPVGPRGGSGNDVTRMSRDEYYEYITKGRGKR